MKQSSAVRRLLPSTRPGLINCLSLYRTNVHAAGNNSCGARAASEARVLESTDIGRLAHCPQWIAGSLGLVPDEHMGSLAAASTFTLAYELGSKEAEALALKHWPDAVADSLSLATVGVEDLRNCHDGAIAAGTSNLV